MFLSAALDTDITSWGGTIVTPGLSAYNKEEHEKQEAPEEEADNSQKEVEEQQQEQPEVKMVS